VTLWLTRILPDLRHPAVRRDLADAVRLHQRVMSLMPDTLGEQARRQAGVLYRLEETRAGTQLLIQTHLKPNFAKLPNGYGATAIRDLGPLLAALGKSTGVHYRLAANTCKRLGRTAEHPGKIVALRGEAAEQWWAQRAERHGLALRTVSATSMADATGQRQGSPRIKHAVTRFDGIAIVTDPDVLRTALHDGIGRGKSHGCGLLTLALAGTR
jgi:CRISPR system Cascade subunit CasE